jgi:hypothetical protein
MSPENEDAQVDDMRQEYSLRGGMRGRFYRPYKAFELVMNRVPKVPPMPRDEVRPRVGESKGASSQSKACPQQFTSGAALTRFQEIKNGASIHYRR